MPRLLESGRIDSMLKKIDPELRERRVRLCGSVNEKEILY